MILDDSCVTEQPAKSRERERERGRDAESEIWVGWSHYEVKPQLPRIAQTLAREGKQFPVESSEFRAEQSAVT